MKYYYTYIVKCIDDSYYVGITNDIERRLEEHNTGDDEKSYTYPRRPVKLVYFEKSKYVLNAIAREKQLKGWSREKKEALIAQNINKLEILSKRKKRRDKILKQKNPCQTEVVLGKHLAKTKYHDKTPEGGQGNKAKAKTDAR